VSYPERVIQGVNRKLKVQGVLGKKRAAKGCPVEFHLRGQSLSALCIQAISRKERLTGLSRGQPQARDVRNECMRKLKVAGVAEALAPEIGRPPGYGCVH
jgi:hypothetical protein